MDAAVPLAGRPPEHRATALTAAWVATSAAIATTAALAVTGADGDPLLVALARSLMVGGPVAVGLYAWRHHGSKHFGLALAAAGAGWFLTTLAEADNSAVYTVGRTAGWFIEV